MRSLPLVVLPRFLHFFSGVFKRREPALIQAFFPDTRFEYLNCGPFQQFQAPILDQMPWGEVTSYLPAIVTYQEWYPTALTLDLARQEVKHSNAEGFPFDLMSAEDIEWLLAWTRYEDPISVLQEMHNDVASKGLSVGQYVGVRAKGKGVTKIEKTPLSIKLA